MIIPYLSITADETEVDEGTSMAHFTVMASYNPGATLNVNYSITQTSGNFLHASVSTGAQTPVDLTFTRANDESPWTATDKISIQLRDADMVNFANGKIDVSLDAVSSTAPVKYFVAPAPRGSATLTIRDVNIPDFTIADAPNTFNGQNAEFVLTSTIETTQPHTIMVKATNGAGTNFLDTRGIFTNGVAVPVSNVSFARTDPSNTSLPFIATLPIPTMVDSASSTGTIEVELVDTSTSNTYNLGSEKTALVTVNKVVTLSIAPPSTDVNEGGTLDFVVTSNHSLETPLSVEYSIAESSNYRHANVLLGAQTPIDLNFSKDPLDPMSPWTDTISVQLRDPDMIDAVDGEITVELIQKTTNVTYIVAGSPANSASKAIKDVDVPMISIANAKATHNEDDAEFTLTSSIESTQMHTIMVKATNETGKSFLDTDGDFTNDVAVPISDVSFARTDPTNENLPFVYTLSIPTTSDSSNTEGGITIELEENSSADTYDLATNKTATVTVYKIVALAITRPTAKVNEGNDGQDLVFTITSDFRPPNDQNNLSVNYTITDPGNYRHASITTGSQTPIDLTFSEMDDTNPNSSWTASLPIQLRAVDNIDALDGTISVTLDPPAAGASIQYQVTPPQNDGNTVTIIDLDKPTISIADASSTFNSEKAEFELTSDIMSTQTHAIMVKAKNTSGSFLDTNVFTNDEAKPVDVQFTGTSTFIGILEIPTVVDDPESGTIEVEILTNSTADTYNLGSNTTATVTVNKLTAFSITEAIAEVIEGSSGSINFTVTARRNPGPIGIPIDVTYSIIDAGNFRHSSVTTGNQTPISLTFTQDDQTNRRCKIINLKS